MSEIERAYRKAPVLKTPSHLDDQILQAARNAPHVTASGRSTSGGGFKRFRLSTPAVALASFCMLGIGTGLLFKSGLLQQSGSNEGVAYAPAADVADNAPAQLQESEQVTSSADLMAESAGVDSIAGELAGELAELQSINESAKVAAAPPPPPPPAAQQRKQMRDSAASASVGNTNAINAQMVVTKEWLLSRDSNAYTLQLLLSDSDLEVKQVSEMLALTSNVIAVNEGQWLLIHGSFDDRGQAQLALDALVDGKSQTARMITAMQPKIVKFDALQQMVK